MNILMVVLGQKYVACKVRCQKVAQMQESKCKTVEDKGRIFAARYVFNTGQKWPQSERLKVET